MMDKGHLTVPTYLEVHLIQIPARREHPKTEDEAGAVSERYMNQINKKNLNSSIDMQRKTQIKTLKTCLEKNPRLNGKPASSQHAVILAWLVRKFPNSAAL
ncbi:hypothetical protein WAI453_012911 [Rhynchosporium graminicola]